MLKCVGTLTKCPDTAGGRSRRGSPKAGTTVVENNNMNVFYKNQLAKQILQNILEPVSNELMCAQIIQRIIQVFF